MTRRDIEMSRNEAAKGIEPQSIRARDPRIDFFRGIALLCIFVDHIPGNFLSRLTLCSWGFSDAAEVFVLLAGTSAALAYHQRPDTTRRIARRVLTIYVAHVALLFAVAAMLLIASRLTGDASLMTNAALLPFLVDLKSAIAQVLTLELQPDYINILPLYLLLLSWLPLLLRATHHSYFLGAAISVTLWICANFFALNIRRANGEEWFFNPFAWQLLFFVGVTIGLYAGKRRLVLEFPWPRLMLAAAIVFLLFSLLNSAPWAQIPVGALRQYRILPADLIGPVSKTYASGWRIAHILALAYTTAWFVERDQDWLRSAIALHIARLGNRPLLIFCLASILSYAAGVGLTIFGTSILVQLWFNVAGLSLLALVSCWPRNFTTAQTADPLHRSRSASVG
jgi:hypothetical protein